MIRTILAICLLTGLAHGQEGTFAQRIKCELDTATGASLPSRSVMQGSTPVWSLEQYRRGQGVAATGGTVLAVLQVAVTTTSAPVYCITNQSASGYGFLVQWPTIATNSSGSQWYYRITYQTGGLTYWTGNGRLTIEPTTWTGQGGLTLNPLPAIYTNFFGE